MSGNIKNNYIVSGNINGIHRGEMLMNTYHVLSDAHEGGMGAVWKVSRNDWPDTSLAMKRPKPKVFQTQKQKENFIHECESWINLGLHPNIVTCYYVSEIDGVPTIFSEWMEKGDVEACIRDGSLYEGSRQEVKARILDIAIQFARGLHYAHENGLVHQDVKPDNVLLTENWEAKVSDFGLAKARAFLSAQGTGTSQLSNDPNATQMAPTGGKTPAYCSPEQAEGCLLTRRTDIYSWAVSVLEMFLGYKPWAHGREITGPLAGIACRDYINMCTEHPIPVALQELLVKCMEKEPANRPHDFGEVETELLSIYRYETGKNYPRASVEGAANTADSLNNQAVSYMEIGLEDSALRCLKKAKTIDAYHMEAMFNRALVDWRTGARTFEEVHRQLMVYPFFQRTETGKQALKALERESGMAEIDKPLMEESPGYSVFTSQGADFRFHQYLHNGKVYIVAPVPPPPPEHPGRCKMHVMTVFDARTGKRLDSDDFAQVRGVEREGRGVIEVVLNNDCTQAMFSMSDDTLVLYDLASRAIVREFSLKKTGMYDTGIALRIIGDDARFIRRLVSHGLGHVPPTDETYDLRTETLIDNHYSDWELIRAGADGELPPPKGLRALSDSRRAIPILMDENGARYCDEDGKAGAPVPDVLLACLDGKVLRITEDRRIWVLGSRRLMEFDLNTGKCLRCFRNLGGSISVDEDGFGILEVSWRRTIAKDKTDADSLWHYRRLEALRPEDRAEWLFSEPENFTQYQDRMKRIKDITARFNQAERENNKTNMCRAYDEAMEIRCFYGTAAQRDMAERLNLRARQSQGEFFLYMEGAVKPEGEAREQILAPFGLGKLLPDDLLRRIREERWVAYNGVFASPDGRRVLVLSRPDAAKAPAGPGMYLLDVPTEKLYLLESYQDRSWNVAGFCSDREHIVYGNIDKDRGRNFFLQFAGIYIGGSQAIHIGEWEPTANLITRENTRYNTREKSRDEKQEHFSETMYCKRPVYGTNVGEALLWPCGICYFKDKSSKLAFLNQAGNSLGILDVCESHGLVVYAVDTKDQKSILRVWSMDEERNLMEIPMSGRDRLIARFGRTESGEINLFVARSGLAPYPYRKEYPFEIYQFRCTYSADKTRRLPPRKQGIWPEITLPACNWRGGRSEATILDDKAHALASVLTPESLYEAYDIHCELARRFPKSKLYHLKNRDRVTEQLKTVMKELCDAGNTEEPEKYVRLFAERLEKYPDEEKTLELLDFTEDLLASVLANLEDAESKRRALALYKGLQERVKDKQRLKMYAKNVRIVKGEIRRLEGKPSLNGGLFSFFGKKK